MLCIAFDSGNILDGICDDNDMRKKQKTLRKLQWFI